MVVLRSFRNDGEDDMPALSETVAESYRRFHTNKMSLRQVASERQLGESTIEGHLATAVELGYPIDVER